MGAGPDRGPTPGISSPTVTWSQPGTSAVTPSPWTTGHGAITGKGRSKNGTTVNSASVVSALGYLYIDNVWLDGSRCGICFG